jgi:hypothetical protein
MAAHEYELSIDLNALNHLGINLYSNVPAVISEVVANSWDADAENVRITIDNVKDTITILDDGTGMSKEDINQRYLKVGYRKRDEMTKTPVFKRHVMGRKGIGKLSLFSITDTIEVRSVRSSATSGTPSRSGFIMNGPQIAKAIENGGSGAKYYPKPISPSTITLAKGTEITLLDLKKDVSRSEVFLRRRLARRFSIIGKEFKFQIWVNGNEISVTDRDYYSKLEYIWLIGDDSDKYADLCPNLKKKEKLKGIINKSKGWKVSGWVGTFDEQKSIEEGNNTIVVQAWGKIVHEDILKDMKEGGLFTKYLIGELRADFLDLDNMPDIVTSDRQRLKENDPRFRKLKKFIQEKILSDIQNKWRDWRNEMAEQKALENPKVKEWFESLSKDNKKYARQLFGKIESFPVADSDVKRELYRQSILAFETLALKENLSALDQITSQQDLKVFASVFSGMDELEMVHYYQITKGRLAVLKKFEHIVPDAKEKLIQTELFNHLWLLDPSWERASTDAKMEETVMKEIKALNVDLTTEQKKGRLDIRYRTAAGRHIIIELKRYKRVVEINDLLKQVRKYRTTLTKVLAAKLPGQQHYIEIICILGSPPQPQDEDETNRKELAVVNTRYITYDELIQQTRDSYRDYIDGQQKLSRIQELINSI